MIRTGHGPYKCAICGVVFLTKSNPKRHGLVHTSIRPFQCDICGKSFARTDGSKRHRIIHTRNESQVPLQDSIDKHNVVHSGDTLLKGVIGESSLSQEQSLQNNMIGQTDKKPYTCESAFARSSLDTHNKAHTVKTLLEGDILESSLPQEHNQKEQNGGQTDEKLYKCILCESSFSASYIYNCIVEITVINKEMLRNTYLHGRHIH
ncbi:hypothetical protein ScPMuIL_018121 [Solemya velum]